MGEYFRDSDHNPVNSEVVMERDKDSMEIKVLNLEKVNFNIIRRDLAKVDWDLPPASRSTSDKGVKMKVMKVKS